MIYTVDVNIAASILRKYHKTAVARQNLAVEAEVKKLMTVLDELYKIAVKHKELDENQTISDNHSQGELKT